MTKETRIESDLYSHRLMVTYFGSEAHDNNMHQAVEVAQSKLLIIIMGSARHHGKYNTSAP